MAKALRNVTNALRCVTERLGSNASVSPIQLQVLFYVAEKGEVTATDVGRDFDITVARSFEILKLIGEGNTRRKGWKLLESKRHPEDGRIQIFYLSPQGEELVEEFIGELKGGNKSQRK